MSRRTAGPRTAAVRIVDVRVGTQTMASPMANAVVDFSEMTASIVAVVSDVVRDGQRLVGFGFNSNGRYAASGLLRDRFLPRLSRADPVSLLDEAGENLDPERIWQTVMRNEKPGGHGERSTAVGALDMAVWDLVAKIAGRPLHVLLAERGGREADADVAVYAAGGYYEAGKGDAGLRAELRGYLDLGYTHVKLKIGGAPLERDVERVMAAIDVAGGEGARVAVDANGRFDTRTALAYAEALEPLGLRWFEEAGDPLDHLLQATLASVYPGPLATGENLFSHQDARNLLRYAGMRPDRDWLQFDPALSYGLTEFLRTLRVLDAHGWSARRVVPHGGHQFALSIAAGLGLGGNESYPGVFQPFGGFADETPVRDGRIAPCTAPGIGIEHKTELYALFRGLLD